MIKKAIFISALTRASIGGFVYGSQTSNSTCPLEGTSACPKVNCPLKGTPQCPYNDKASCCAKIN